MRTERCMLAIGRATRAAISGIQIFAAGALFSGTALLFWFDLEWPGTATPAHVACLSPPPTVAPFESCSTSAPAAAAPTIETVVLSDAGSRGGKPPTLVIVTPS